MTFDRLTRQFLVWPFGITGLTWLLVLTFYQPRSLLLLVAHGVSVLCGLAAGSVFPYAVRQLIHVPATRVPINFLMLVLGAVPLSFVLLAVAAVFVVLFGG